MVLTAENFQQVAEERVTMNKCCNLECLTQVDSEYVKKLLSRKFNILRSGKIEENTDPRVFCDKVSTLKVSLSKCEQKYNMQMKKVLDLSDGGLFSSSFDNALEMLDKHCSGYDATQPDTSKVNKAKVIDAVVAFRLERDKIAGPVVQRKIVH